MALASRHRLRLVVYGSQEPPAPDGATADLNFRVRIDGTTAAELLDGFLKTLQLCGFDEPALGSAITAAASGVPVSPEPPQTPPAAPQTRRRATR